MTSWRKPYGIAKRFSPGITMTTYNFTIKKSLA
jgi:hypothetical protein